ncbi:MAG: SDR family oxidoreductase [Pseudomonadota bacterium]|nr:SDR family oxidoreductase [Pseudomonadota bacterium]
MTQPIVHGLSSPRHALVTGASSGVGGRVVVQQLPGLADVAQVFAVSRGANDSPALAALQATHRERIRALAADITSEDALQALASSVRAHTDGLAWCCTGTVDTPLSKPNRSS